VKVSFARRGGWAAAINLRSPPAVLDADTLPRAEREELNRLVRAAFARRGQEGGAGRKAAGSYTITVEDGGKRQTLSVADAEEEKEPAAAALREWIEARLHRR
jgi:hypothetical protein